MTTFPPSLRPATWSDHPRIAVICSSAFRNDGLFAATLHPYLAQYPSDYSLFWLRDLQLNWWNPRRHVMVSTIPDVARPGKDLVVGVAKWERMGPGVQRRWWHPFAPLMNGVMRLWVRFSSWIWPNRAAEPRKLGIFKEAWPFIMHLWTGERERCWDLNILAVDPAYGGRGAGRKLVRSGLDKAEEEGVAASVKMAPGKEKFYELSGFDSGLVGNCGQGEGNPMAHVKGGNIFFRDPKRKGVIPTQQ